MVPVDADIRCCVSHLSEHFYLSFTFRADEELFDQKKYLEDSCKPKCVKPLIEYEVK